MKPITIRDLRDELKIAFRENNKFIFKQVKIDTKNSIKSAIQANNKILVKQIDQVVNARTTEMSTAFVRTMDEMHQETNQKIDGMSKDVRDLKQDVKFMHQDIKDIVVDMSDKPSRRQFETFKSKFDNYPTV